MTNLYKNKGDTINKSIMHILFITIVNVQESKPIDGIIHI